MRAACSERLGRGKLHGGPLRGEKDRCLHVAVTGADGTLFTAKGKDATVSRFECDAKPGALRIVFAGGRVALATPVAMVADFAPACGARQ